MLRDHDPITLSNFSGIFDRGEDDVCPPDYFLDALNVVFKEGSVETRFGTSLSVSLNNIRRAKSYKRPGEADRLLLLDGSGNLWDSTNLVTPILTIVAMTDFGMVSLYGRAYITPHNGVRGLPGQSVYVYEGSGAARIAAGGIPSGATMVAADNPAAGSVEAGGHLFAVAFETSTGYITRPGPEVYTLYTAPGGKKVDLSGVLVGPAGTIRRHILASKILPVSYNGDQSSIELFFVPNGTIGDNVTTIITLNFFDADLSDSADYLADELTSIPAGVGIGVYGSRMVVCGPDDDESRVWVSKAGYPESFDAVEGFLRAFPGDAGGGVKNVIEYRSRLYLVKSLRTYATEDTGDNAAFWSVTAVDQSVGSECHGVMRVLDIPGSALDVFAVADRSGLLLYNGTFSGGNLTWSIDDIWERVNKNAFNQIEVAMDPVRSLIYVAVPLDAAVRNSHVLVGDFQEGLGPDTIRWVIWSFPKAPTTIVVDTNTVTKKTQFRFGSEAHNVYVYDESVRDDFGTAISNFIEFAKLPNHTETEDELYHFGGVRLRIKGSGTLNLELKSMDDVLTELIPSLSIIPQPGRPYWRPINFVAEHASLKLSMNGLTDYFILNWVHLFHKIQWLSRYED